MNVKTYILGILALIAATSCSSNKTQLPYFTDIESVQLKTSVPGEYLPKIQPDDELFITVTSPNPETTAIYNQPYTNPASRGTLELTGVTRQQTYVVSSKGYITVPGIGDMHVAGMTIEQLRDDILERVRRDVADASVSVELVNFYVNVAGEVYKPGRFQVTGNRYSVLDAISDAGDLNPYGERENVLVIREVDGKKTFGRINLNSAESLNSPYYYLQQNDYIYVEPNNVRQSNSRYNQENSYRLQVASTLVSVASVITSLVIALAVK